MKKKVCELHVIIDKLKNNKYQSSTNSNYNGYLDKHPIPSTPSQLHKISIMNNNKNNTISNNNSLMGYKNGNIMANNSYKSYENNIRGRSNFIENKNGISNDGLEIKQKKNLENYKNFLSQLEPNMQNNKP